MGLILDWQKKLGYSKDPFEGVFLPASRYIVGSKQLQDKLNLFIIKEERFGTISGPSGSGKTLLLQWMNEVLAPEKSHRQQLLDGKLKREELVNALLEPHLSFFERKFGSLLKRPLVEQEKELHKRMGTQAKNVLLIDNAGGLSKHELELIGDIAVKTKTYIIFADTEERLKKLALPEMLMDKLKLKMPEYTAEDLTELLAKRINAAGVAGTYPFDEKELQVLYKRSDKNPAKFLALAKERAIELSLKVTAAPKPAPRPGLISIKIQKVNSPQPKAQAPETHEWPVPKEEIVDTSNPEVRAELPTAVAQEAAMLEAVVLKPSANPKPRVEHKTTVKAPAEKVENVVVEKTKPKKTAKKTKADKVVASLSADIFKRSKSKPKR